VLAILLLGRVIRRWGEGLVFVLLIVRAGSRLCRVQ
jgi:hypothetical protein